MYTEAQKAAGERYRRRKGIRPRVVDPVASLLGKRIITDRGCWEWPGKRTTKNGYVLTTTGKRNTQTYLHRLAYVSFVGPIPEGKELDHLCRNRRYFNPEHLEPVTRSENTRRGIGPAMLGALNGSKTHCAKGHPFDASNTYPRPNGGRACRICRAEAAGKYNSKRRRAT